MRYHYDQYESLKVTRDGMKGILDTHGFRIRIHIPERKWFSGSGTGSAPKSDSVGNRRRELKVN